MEWAYEITKFLPIKIEDVEVLKYINYHIEKLEQSIEHKIETWIFFHTHILYMTFVYFQLLRISQIKEKEFKYSWIWLSNNEKDFLKHTWNPFAFSWLNEKTVFRFFRLIDFDDWTIWDISACINDRNNFLHSSWKNIDNLDKKIEKYISNMEKISEKSKIFIVEFYHNFLDNNTDLLEDWYTIWYDDLESNLYIPYYTSNHELEKLVEWQKTWKIIDAIKLVF